MTDSSEIKVLIREQLPSILAEDASICDLILQTVSDYYSPRRETDQKFEEFKNRIDRILDELQRNREEQTRNDYDPDGLGFGRLDQVEIDVIIKNGLVIVCAIKSFMSKADIYTFSCKAEFYQQKYQRIVNRKIVISPMILLLYLLPKV